MPGVDSERWMWCFGSMNSRMLCAGLAPVLEVVMSIVVARRDMVSVPCSRKKKVVPHCGQKWRVRLVDVVKDVSFEDGFVVVVKVKMEVGMGVYRTKWKPIQSRRSVEWS